MSDAKRIYRFGNDAQGDNVTEGSAEESRTLGGKGANLAEMARIGLPVPPGFTIACQTCAEYAAGGAWPEGVPGLVAEALRDLEERAGKRLGDPRDPLLVSVRSSAPVPTPGMADTVLDLGMNDQSVRGLMRQTGSPRFAWDSYRRFIQMFSVAVAGVDPDLFENAVTTRRLAAGARSDAELSAEDLQGLVRDFKEIFSENASAAGRPGLVGADGRPAFPQDPGVQLLLAVQAVFDSWSSPRAALCREQSAIPDGLGTAVTVMGMVFGNKGDTSATGVAFTRNPADGARELYGDYLVNAQGEDVVAGARDTEPIENLKRTPGLEKAGAELERAAGVLERHYRDMMDIEFTVEEGRLYLLQTRVGKRTAAAALKVAVDMAEEGLITKEEALLRVDPGELDQLAHPRFDKTAGCRLLCRGLGASPGAVVGEAVFSSADAVEAAARGRDCVLVRWETNPDDLPGMAAAKGVLTSHGGMTSHAAVVARGMGKPCVCGAGVLRIDAGRKEAAVGGAGAVLREGDAVSIDGATGAVVLGAAELAGPELSADLRTLLSWADEARGAGVEAGADGPAGARLAAAQAALRSGRR